MTGANITAHLVSDHNIEVLGRYLETNSEPPTIHAHIAPYGQVFQTLAMPDEEYGPCDIGVVWTRTESVSETFGRACYFEDVNSGDQACLVGKGTRSRGPRRHMWEHTRMAARCQIRYVLQPIRSG